MDTTGQIYQKMTVIEPPGFRYFKLLLYDDDQNPTDTEIDHIRFYDVSDGITSNPNQNSIQITYGASDYSENLNDPYPSDFSKVHFISRSNTVVRNNVWEIFNTNNNSITTWTSNNLMKMQRGHNEAHTVSHRGRDISCTEIVLDFTNLIYAKYIALGGVNIVRGDNYKRFVAYHNYRLYAQVSKNGTKWVPKYLTWDDSKRSTESNGFFYKENYTDPSYNLNQGVFKIEDNYNPLFNINRISFTVTEAWGRFRIRFMRIFGKKNDDTEEEKYKLDISNTIGTAYDAAYGVGRLPMHVNNDLDFSWNDISEQYKAYRFEMEIDDENQNPRMPIISNLKIYKTNGNVGEHIDITSNYNNPNLPLLWWNDTLNKLPLSTNQIFNTSGDGWNNNANSTPANYNPSLYIY
jgi:hypothetical protein